MGFLYFYNLIFYQPLFNALVYLTKVLPFHDLGLAVISLTVIVRLVIFPFTHRSIKSQIKMKSLEPELQKIREEFKDKKEEQGRKTMELYRRHGVSPFSGCLMLLVQLPILIALYQVFSTNFGEGVKYLYSFVSLPPLMNTKFLGLVELTKGSVILAALAAFTQFFQIRLSMPALSVNKSSQSFQNDFQRAMSVQSKYILPVFIFFISFRLPAAIALYWTTLNFFAIIHEGWVRKKANETARENKIINRRDIN